TQTVMSISSTADPLGGGLIYHFNSSGCPDYPRLGVSSDLVVFTDSLFADCAGGSFIGGEVTVLSKQALLAGSLRAADLGRLGPNSSDAALAPAQPTSNQAGMFMASTRGGTATAFLYSVTSPSQTSIPANP